MENKACNEALLRIVPRIDIDDIEDFIDNVPYISKLQKDFYKTYLNARFEKIILPVYKQLLAINSVDEKIVEEQDNDEGFVPILSM